MYCNAISGSSQDASNPFLRGMELQYRSEEQREEIPKRLFSIEHDAVRIRQGARGIDKPSPPEGRKKIARQSGSEMDGLSTPVTHKSVGPSCGCKGEAFTIKLAVAELRPSKNRRNAAPVPTCSIHPAQHLPREGLSRIGRSQLLQETPDTIVWVP